MAQRLSKMKTTRPDSLGALAVSLLITSLIAVTACSAKQPKQPSPQITLLVPTEHPSYLVEAYATSRHPKLTVTQRTTLQTVVANAKPCQLPFIRYAFTENHHDLAMFFLYEDRFPYPQEVKALGENSLYDIDRGSWITPPGPTEERWTRGLVYDLQHRTCKGEVLGG